MFPRRGDASKYDSTDTPAVGTPDAERDLELHLDRVAEEKRLAREDPGPSWSEWFFFDAAKWWIGIVFLIVDAWVVGYWLEVSNLAGLIVSLAAALYLEFLGYRFLWYRPKDDDERAPGPFRATWARPVEFGRWTPEGVRLRSGLPVERADGHPDPREFL